jgi:hypothetical protein
VAGLTRLIKLIAPAVFFVFHLTAPEPGAAPIA